MVQDRLEGAQGLSCLFQEGGPAAFIPRAGMKGVDRRQERLVVERFDQEVPGPSFEAPYLDLGILPMSGEGDDRQPGVDLPDLLDEFALCVH